VRPLFENELQTLSEQLKTTVKLKQGHAGKGTLIIHYDDPDALEHMINRLISRD
jgi:ParB family chromosome partitioning protein